MTDIAVAPARPSVQLAAAARRALGPVGVSLSNYGSRPASIDEMRQAVRRLEALGYGAVWNNEGVGGRDAFVQLSLLLGATERIVFGTSIANMLAREPETAEGAAASLAEAFPDRFVLGLGVGYRYQADVVGRPFGSPMQRTREYIARMNAPKPTQHHVDAPYARIIAANGPRMLALAGEIADGAMPTVVPPSFTAEARRILGPDRLLVVGITTFFGIDRAVARAAARRATAAALSVPGSPYAANLVRQGFDPADVVAGGDAVVDAIAACGDADDVLAKVAEHRAAGADHVILTVPSDLRDALGQLDGIAAALGSLR